MTTIRRFRAGDAPLIWALNGLPNIGHTADATVALPLTPVPTPPAAFPDLADVGRSFLGAGGEFLVAEFGGHLAGMGGVLPGSGGQAEVLRVRVHPATRRRGVGRALMGGLERWAARSGMTAVRLDTATNQPDAVAFYRGLGYREVGREQQPGWTWTLVYFEKALAEVRSTGW